MRLREVDVELDLEDSYNDIVQNREQEEGIYGVVNRIAQVEKEKLGIKEWSELGLEQWEEMLGKPDEWIAQDLQNNGHKYYDSVTGLPLEEEEVRKKRGEEIRNFCKQGAWKRETREKAFRDPNWLRKPLSGRWVDVQKADGRYRSRWVAKEFNTSKDRDEFYAPTAPYAMFKALMVLLSEHRPLPETHPDDLWGVLAMDVTQAYLNAPATRTVYVQLPPELDPNGQYCAKLVKTLYGCRDGASNWGEHLATTLQQFKSEPFTRGKVNPCSFYQRKSGVRGLVHSDDGFFCGPRWALKRLEKELKEYFEIKSQMVGPCIDEGDKQE